jgi:hypothetical protein
MKEVYYKGQAFPYKVVVNNGKREFQLLENGTVKYSVDENELDVKSIVSLILDSYYRNVKPASKSAAMG